MNPWDLLGWILVAWVGAMILVRMAILLVDLYGYASQFTRDFYRHLKTYRTPPAIGQIWHRTGQRSSISIRGVYPTHISIEAGNTSFSMKNDEWKRFIRRPRTYLVRIGKGK